MSYEFERLSDVEAVEEFPEEGASVLIEHEGDIKKCPADGIGGGGAHIYRFELVYENRSISPTEQCDETTIAADLEAGITPFALIDMSYDSSEGEIAISQRQMILIPLQWCSIMTASGGDYDGYKNISIMFKSQTGGYDANSIEGHCEGIDVDIEWEFNLD